ncbi:MAG: tRNA (guanine(10)-N(2))-dimethyltransferase [Candidatus Altiarchaeota archaeon]|nr:tRNA (guanine(10)-N(2))-dimethyltransferase [Candidatus Altiarchaeota archaeon]
MDLRGVNEGKTRLIVPVVERLTRKNIVFFNPQMELNRDISVAVAKLTKPEHFCDALSGSGARGVRMANEVGCQVTANDSNPKAVESIRKNAELNSVAVNATNLDANLLMSQGRFDSIDIDPFGTPVRFIDSAVRSIRNEGVLAVTATDTSALCGTYPQACRRKYDSSPLRTDYYNELGLRILLGYVGRAGLKYDLCIQPLFSHCTRHYLRVYVRVKRSRKSANKSLQSMGYIQHCFRCLYRGFSGLEELKTRCDCGSPLRTAGPLWVSCFADPEFCKRLEQQLLEENFRTLDESLRLVSIVGAEQQVFVPYYDVHKVYGKLGVIVAPMGKVMERLKGCGFKATRTHFSPIGVRTDARAQDVYDTLRS